MGTNSNSGSLILFNSIIVVDTDCKLTCVLKSGANQQRLAREREREREIVTCLGLCLSLHEIEAETKNFYFLFIIL